MIKWSILLLIVVVLLMGLSPVGTLNAATPTPTLRPLQPTQTSIYLYLRPTPTPLSISPSEDDFPIDADGGQLADLAINMYRWANRDHALDLVGTFLLASLTVMYLARSVSRLTKDVE